MCEYINWKTGKELKFTVTISLPNLFRSRGAYGCIIAARSVDRECHWRQRSTRDIFCCIVRHNVNANASHEDWPLDGGEIMIFIWCIK